MKTQAGHNIWKVMKLVNFNLVQNSLSIHIFQRSKEQLCLSTLNPPFLLKQSFRHQRLGKIHFLFWEMRLTGLSTSQTDSLVH